MLSLNFLFITIGLNMTNGDYDVQATSGFSIETINVPVEKAPQIELDYNKNWTNEKRILVHVSVQSPVNKKISHIWLPDGQVTNVTSFTYAVVGNGVYTFKAMDSGGAYGYASVVIDKVDTKTPTIQFTTPGGWLTKDPSLVISVNNQL